MKKLKKQRSVLPVYLIAVVWLIGCFGLHIHKLFGLCALFLISVAVFFIGKLIWPDRKIVVTVPDEKKKPEPAKAKPAEPEDPEIAALRTERDRAINEMHRLNDSIKDPGISAQIDSIESTTGKIFAHVMEHPEKKSQIRQFMNYYLPTTLKLLNAYDRMDAAGVSGVNIDGTKGKISDMMATIVTAFDRQLDALFAGDALDINADIKVLEQLMASEGLVDQGPAAKA